MKTAFLHTHRPAIYLVALFFALLAMAGLGRLQAEANYRVYFDAGDPLLILESAVNQRFSQSDSAVLVLQAGAQNLLAPAAMRAYEALERQLLDLPFVSRVAGFYQFVVAAQDIVGEDGEDLFATTGEDSLDFSPEGLWQQLLQHPRGRDLVSENRRFSLIEVRVHLAGEDAAGEVQQAMAQIRQLAGQTLLETGVVAGIGYSGALALNEAYIDVVRHDLKLFVPGLLGSMALILFLVFRNWRLVFLPLVSGLLAAAMAMGIAGWAGWTLAAINAFTPIIIVSLHLAASMHVIVSFLQLRAGALSPTEAVARSLAFNLPAMKLSALTTAAGFLLLALSPSPPVRITGYCVAIGVGISYLLNTVLLPLQLSGLNADRLPPLPLLQLLQLQRINGGVSAERITACLNRSRRSVVLVATLFTLGALLLLHRAQINDSVYTYFPADHSFSRGIQQLDQQFSGCVRLAYTLGQSDDNAALTEEFADVQIAFAAWLRDQPEVGGVNEIYGLMARQGLNLEQARQRLQQRSVADYGIEGLVTPALSATRVEVLLPALSSKALIAFDERARQWLGIHGGDMHFEGGIGPDLIFAWLGQRNARSMFISLGIALAGIGLLLGVLFRSPAMALLGLVCNLLPLVLVYALWFAFGGYISLGAAVVLGMIMGVIVDDTLHLLCKYRRLADQGDHDPVLELSRRVLPAVTITSLTLAVGLSIGMLSDFRPLRELSLLSAAVILAAWLVDALVLPAVLMMRRPTRT